MRFTKEHPLRVGTDCSGIEAPIMALRHLKIPFSHEFSSEIDAHCVASLRANYKPKILFGDMTKRKLKDIPDIDLYVCGFPCQSFSIAGQRQGIMDPRGTLFWECFQVIRYKKPTFFILENVKGLLSMDEGKTFQTMLTQLATLKKYHIEHRVLNTQDYGIPQSRPRVFIVGILKHGMVLPAFPWPKPVPLFRPLCSYVDTTDTTSEPWTIADRTLLSRIPKNACFIDLCFSYRDFPNSDRSCPCLNCSPRLWCVPYHRRANTKEYLALQGFPTNFKKVVTDPQLQRQLGNSMSVNVVAFLLKMLLECVH